MVGRASAYADIDGDGERQVMPTRGYPSQSELPVTFGLGTADRVDSLVVPWPDGSVQHVDEVAVDRLMVITRP